MQPRIAVWIVTFGLFLMTASSNLQVPLYPDYAQAAHVGVGISTLAFAVYLLGALPVLAGMSGLISLLGAKKSLILAMTCALLANLFTVVFPNLSMLCVARVLQGISIGFAMSATMTYLVGIETRKVANVEAAPLVTISSSLGFGSGSLVTALALKFANAPTLVPLSLPIASALTVIFLLLYTLLPVSSPLTTSKNANHSARKSWLNVPSFPVGSLFCGLVIALCWSVSGVVLSVLPAQFSRIGLGHLTGIALFCVSASGAVFYPFSRKFTDVKSVQNGLIILAAGTAVLVVGALTQSVHMVFLGAIMSGSASYGFCYLGTLARVTQLGGNDPGRAINGYLLLAYLGFGLPSIVVGFASDVFGIDQALTWFTGCIILCCLLLLAKTREELTTESSPV